MPWGGGVGAVGGGQARANGGRWGVNKTMRNENWKGWRIIRRIANEELGIYYACWKMNRLGDGSVGVPHITRVDLMAA